MGKEQNLIPLANIITVDDKTKVNRAFIEVMLNDDIPVLCVNRSAGKKRLMPFKALYGNNSTFWLQTGIWEYYIFTDEFEKIKEKTVTKTGVWDTYERKESEKSDSNESMKNSFGDKYKEIAAMSNNEKVEVLNKNKEKLNILINQKTKDKVVVTQALVDTTQDAALVNQVALEEAMRFGDNEAKRLTQDLVDSTHEMVKSSTTLFSQNVFSDELMNTLVEKSNGTIVQHMTRVYLNGIAFLLYYNNLVLSSSAINKIRITFAEKYRNYYSQLLPHIPNDDIILEKVFYGGMRAITPDRLLNWAEGFLIHDIGKAAAVEYHEGETAYDRNIVVDHVKQGYTSIMNKTNYPKEASLITGYHHEYYGDPAGYGYFRAYLDQYRKLNSGIKQDYVISYDIEPVLDFQVIAYFPAKILEIIDVYDSVTDPNRHYRKAMLPVEALTMLQDEFINKHLKLDPILFDLFKSFILDKLNKQA